ncbi:hypothetical protein FXF51_35270 [Nonomuraea sp. PA05]|uniref:hypothetical protein n=1 Tax=Nonomuraea sp. PA05 TaxID=2604466 RepID=UPI0011D89BD0|nr:hypothetical protein [Nonomuraea sp. PA05]TYB59231.1 hypothetical protein FXF51_35270 [Nonomuraea sp. PA05]
MRTKNVLAALTAAPLAAALIAVPAHAATAAPACPAPTKAELKGQDDSDKPAKGTKALRGVRVRHLPKGFTNGWLSAMKDNGITEYGYTWSDNRDDIDLAHRSLWVRVVCWPKATKLSHLKKLPVSGGTFAGNPRTVKLGGRTVLRKEGDGALGHGRFVGWVERPGVVVTVMASQPLVPELAAIVRGIKL